MDRLVSHATTQQMKKDLQYTCEERAVIDGITHVYWPGRGSVPFSKDAVHRFSTEAGISKQIDDFQLRQGLLYYIVVKDGRPSMLKISAELTTEAFRKMFAFVMKEDTNG